MPRSPRSIRRPLRTSPRSSDPDLFGHLGGVREASSRFADTGPPRSSVELLGERASRGGLEALSDVEVLELLISKSTPTGAHVQATVLIARFGCLRRVLTADVAALCALVDTHIAVDLQLIYDATRRLAAAELPGRCLLTSWSALLSYLKLTMAHCEREAFRVLFLDKKNQLLADEVMNQGTVDHAPVYPREVMRRALEVSAAALILVHNHPSGDPTPSSADVEMTRRVVGAARALGISVHDHVVVGRTDVASLKSLGLM